MSGKTITRYVLICDGCGSESSQYDNAIEARAATYADGWRFPNKLKADGSWSGRSSDVCPKCVDGWAPVSNRRPQKETR